MAIVLAFTIAGLVVTWFVMAAIVKQIKDLTGEAHENHDDLYTAFQCIADNASDCEHIRYDLARHEKTISDNRKSCNANLVSLCKLSNEITRNKFEYVRAKEMKDGRTD